MSKPRRLHLWLEGETQAERYTLRLDGRPLPAEVESSARGTLLYTDAPTDTGTLELIELIDTVDTVDAGRAAGRRWTLELTPQSSAYREGRGAAIEALRAGSLSEAQSILSAARASVPLYERPLLACVEAQLAYEAMDHEAVRDGPERIAAAAARAGARPLRCLSAARLQAAYFHLYVEPDFNASEAQLAAALDEFEGPVVHLLAALDMRYFQGTLEFRLGHLDEALTALGRATALAEPIHAELRLAAAGVMEATVLARLGRFAEAQVRADALAARWEPELHHELQPGAEPGAETEPSAQVLDLLSTLAWIALLRRDLDPEAPDPSPQLRALARAYADRGDPRNASHMHLNLGLAALQRGDLEAVDRELTTLELATLDPTHSLWRELLAAQADLQRGRVRRSLEHLERAQGHAELTHDREHDWQLWALRGAAERKRGQTGAALTAYERADAIANELALAIPGDAGRSFFVTSHGRATAEHVELLVEIGDKPGAFCTAVSARARHLRAQWARARPRLPPERRREYQRLLSEHQRLEASLAERSEDAWELSETELVRLRLELAVDRERARVLLAQATAVLEAEAPSWTCTQLWPRDPARAVMTMAPSEHGWRFFLATRDPGAGPDAAPTVEIVEIVEIIDAVELADPSPTEIARAALAAFAQRPRWSKLDALDLIATHEFVAVEFHRLLAVQTQAGPGPRVVRHSLGLGASASEISPRTGPLRVAVVASAPDLAAAHEEARAVSERLGGLGARVSSRWSPRDLEQPALLHYSGHGYHEGLLGWGSYLEIDGQTVRAAEIVAGQRAPDIVVLGACSAGTPSPEAIDGGMNLASAFLLAGAQLVIAPTRPVDDRVARDLAIELYAQGELDPDALSCDLADALVVHLGELQRAELSAGSPRDLRRSRLSWRAWTP